MPVGQVLKKMVDEAIGCVMVVDGGKLVGIFSERDALMKLNVDAPKLMDEAHFAVHDGRPGHARNQRQDRLRPATR